MENYLKTNMYRTLDAIDPSKTSLIGPTDFLKALHRKTTTAKMIMCELYANNENIVRALQSLPYMETQNIKEEYERYILDYIDEFFKYPKFNKANYEMLKKHDLTEYIYAFCINYSVIENLIDIIKVEKYVVFKTDRNFGSPEGTYYISTGVEILKKTNNGLHGYVYNGQRVHSFVFGKIEDALLYLFVGDKYIAAASLFHEQYIISKQEN